MKIPNFDNENADNQDDTHSESETNSESRSNETERPFEDNVETDDDDFYEEVDDDFQDEDDVGFDTADGSAAVKINIQSAEHSTIKGYEVNNYYSYVTEYFKWLETNAERISKNNSVFVQGSGLKIPATFNNQRVIIINGGVHTGRYSLALNIAEVLAPRPEKKIFTLQCFVKTSLFAILLDKNLPSESVFIVRNAFNDPGILLRELQESVHDIKGILKQSNSYLIFTNDQDNLEFPKDVYSVPDTGIAPSDLITIFSNHIRFLEDKLDKKLVSYLKRNKRVIQELVDILKCAYYIDDFVKSLSDFQYDEENLETILLSQAKQISKPDLQLNNWFEALTDIEKYFAFTIALFPDLRRVSLIKRFTADTNKLRQGKTNLAQVADQGFQDYLRKTASRLSDWDTVEFEDPKLLTFVLTQLQNNFFFHYWGLREEYVKEIKGHADRDDIETRISFSRALGELGKSDFDGLEDILTSLGVSEIASIRASVGYCLKQVCSETGNKGNVEKLLLAWSQQPDPVIRWTAVAIGEKLYWEFQDTVINIINRLVSDWRNSHAIIHALVKLSRIDPQKISSVLLRWFDESEFQHNAIQRRIAIKASYKILSDLKPGNSRRRIAVVPLLKRMFMLSENHCKRSLGQIQNWIVRESNDNWEDVSNLIAETIISDNTSISEVIIDELKTNWLSHKNTTLRKISEDLLNYHKTTAIDSDPNINKGTPAGLILVDITSASGQAIKFSQDLTKRLTWAKLDVHPMGISDFRDIDSTLWVSRGNKPVRLIGSLLEKKNPDDYAFLLIITLGDVIDISDWVNSPWNNKKMLVYDFETTISKISGITYLKTLVVDRLDMLLQSQIGN